MKKLEVKKVERETEKAINATVIYDGDELTIWLPKSSAKIVGDNVEVKEAFWRHKEAEILSDRRNKGRVKIFASHKEFEKSIGINVTIYECVSEQSIRRMMFFPKSLVSELNENSFVVPAWIFFKNEQKLKEDNASMNFSASTFEVEIEKEFIDNK
jgi:hypothetical protein